MAFVSSTNDDLRSLLKPTPPTVIVGFPVTFRAHPARPIGESRSASGNAGIENTRVLASNKSTPASTSGARIASNSRSEEHTSELQSLMRISYAVFCLNKKNSHIPTSQHLHTKTLYS